MNIGYTPKLALHWFATFRLLVAANTGTRGRYLATSRPARPDPVSSTIALAPASIAHCTADEQIDSASVIGFDVWLRMKLYSE